MHRRLIGLIFALLAALSATAAAAQSRYAIRSGDVLQVEVLEDSSLNRSVLVLPDGTISFPFVGTMQAAGRSVDEVRTALTSGLASNFAAPPNVYVSVGQLSQRRSSSPAAAAAIDIFTMGEIAKPGRFELPRGTTLLQALASAGGFTKFAASKRVELHRTDPASGTEQIYTFSYRGGGIPGSTVLQDGDVIVVPERRLFE
ncbi:polysaccharide export outer membrane protein [Rhodovulum iodosum]|uniref:Polysaccharide export outer membrane protein n=1 Tax=Rhodovulum iodosum TaxID=68291 RepID=A0ABV3Y0V5_9RHOB|nr:polysaccharide biosynthesis/export family protein [Rhodovulum robiginosum]RSK38863.1 polysaccharide export protein [Rhodovulum robiginosum]